MSRFVLPALALACAAVVPMAHAGTTFQLDRAQAAPGETVDIRAVYFNDTPNAVQWAPARQLILQWRSADGTTLRTLAYLAGEPIGASVPVNNFAQMTWRAVVPPNVDGLQAVSIEGEPALLALDVSGRERSAVAGTPAVGPIVDVGRPDGTPGTGAPLPPGATAGLGEAASVGPAPNAAGAAGQRSYSAAAWEHFRNALSPYEPVYFAVGTRDGTNARFQISAKYRLLQPPVDRPAAFHENVYLGYTQTSIWDLDSPSKPFYDTTYNPSVFWMKENVWQSPSQRWFVGLNAGVEHQSNGRDGDESRSFNAFYAQPALNYRFDGGSTLSVAPRLRKYFAIASENPDIADFRGRVDWRLAWTQDDGAMISGLWRNGRGGRDSYQVDLAWPLRDTWFSRLNGYLHVQYVNGYGESLLDYNTRQPDQFRVGLMLVR